MKSHTPSFRLSFLRFGLSTCPGYTLIELITVLAIMGIVSALVLSGISGVSGDLKLSDGGSKVYADLIFARQVAIARNQTVEVRFYQDTSNNSVYDSMVDVIPPTASMPIEWLEKPNLLPQNLAFYTNNVGGVPASSLITATTGSSPTGPVTDAGSGTPSRLQGQKYVAFHFRSDGSTDLDQSVGVTNWCVTIYNTNNGNGTLPSNFITIVLDPTVGRVRLYQPH